MYAGTLLARAATLYPTNTALLYEDHAISYCELFARASSLSRLLRARGVQPRDRVLICIENTPFFYIAYYAAWQIGAVVVPLNTFLKEVELAHIVHDAQPALITHAERVPYVYCNGYSVAPILVEADLPIAGDSLRDDELVRLEQDEMGALLYTSGNDGTTQRGRCLVLKIL